MADGPSPALFAKHQAERSVRYAPGRALSNLRDHYPQLSTELSRFGLDIVESIENWEREVGPEQVGRLADPSTSAFELAIDIRDTAARRGLPTLAYLTVEALLGAGSGSIAGYLRSAGTSLERVLAQLSESLGASLLDAAFKVTWQRPAVFARALESARAYLEWTRQSDLLADREPRRGIQTRLGIAAVLAARFGPISERDLRNARLMLLDSHEKGAESALEYFVEASIWLYDLFDDPTAIREAGRHVVADATSDAAGSIMTAHLWLRLAGIASRPGGVEGFLARGRHVVDGYRWITNRTEDAALCLLSAAFDQLEVDLHAGVTDLTTRGILFPFGHRRPDTPTSRLFERSLPRLIDALRGSERAGDFVFRDLLATYYSLNARLTSTAKEDAARALRDAISIRSGSGKDRAKPLNRLGIEVDQAADRFLLAELSGSPEMRRLGFVELIRASGPDDLRPRYLTMIAKEVEERGALTGGFVSAPEEIGLAIRRGDAASLFEAAARAAYSSADLTQVLLGGRGGVVTLRDSDGVAGQTFVYKRTSPEAKARDEACSEAVARALANRNLGQRFGVIEHLTDIPSLEVESDSPTQVVSVRRYTDGVALLNHLRSQEPEGASKTLSEVADFLALIHHAQLETTNLDRARVDMKEKELGRWLRALQLSDDERMGVFGQWWDVIASAPLLPRRDAHPLNWLIGSDEKILAVDLESQGARPLGYELAQLVEDGQVLPASDFDGRDPIIERYISTWDGLAGERLDRDLARGWYDAGALARAVRAISMPSARPAQRAYGGDLLDSLSKSARGDATRQIARELSQRWRKLTGRVGSTSSGTLTEAGRQRISRAMSHHLRHDSDMPTSRAGWVHVDELTQALRSSGHKVSSDQLLLIAGALGEPRFELDGEDIRAAYGHSIRVNIPYESRRPPRVLYHATPTQNLASIFEARSGLKPGGRTWVHLTESCAIAVDASRRQHAAVSVLEIDAANVTGLVHASGTTWLAPIVPVGALRILAVRRVEELTRDPIGALDRFSSR